MFVGVVIWETGPFKRLKNVRVHVCCHANRPLRRQGSPQYICARLAAPGRPAELRLQFQGGFAGADCWLEAGGAPADLRRLHAFYPDNSNRLQTFSVTCPEPVTHVRVVFNTSTDFFGRVVVYKFDLLAAEEARGETGPVT